MERRRILIFLPLLLVFAVIHLFLNISLFPNLTSPVKDYAKYTYEGIALGLYSGICYFISYFTKNTITTENEIKDASPSSPKNPLIQGFLLALILYVGLRVNEALVNIFITVFDDLRGEGEIQNVTTYGMNVIDYTLSGFLFFFGWIPLCIYSTMRVTRKLNKNPGLLFFFLVSATVLIGSIITNYQSTGEWSQALIKTLAPIFGAQPEKIYPRDVLVFITIQIFGTLVLSIFLALFMWLTSEARNRLHKKLDSLGV